MIPSKTFNNRRLALKFEYPADWKLNFSSGDELILTAPGRKDEFRAMVQITFNQYKQLPLSELFDQLCARIASRKPGFELVQKECTELANGRETGRLVYRNTQSKVATTDKVIMFQLLGNTYVIAFAMVAAELLETYQAHIDLILDTLSVTEDTRFRRSFWKRLLSTIGR